MRNFRIILFIITICVFNKGEAQVLINDSWKDEVVETIVQVLPVTDGKKIDTKELLSGRLDNQFVPFESEFITGKQTNNWLKLNIKNNTDEAKSLYLGTNKFEYMRFWTVRDTIISDEMLGGHLRPFPEKQVPMEGFSFFNFQVAPRKSVDIILNIENKNAPITPQNHVPLSLMTEEYFNEFYKQAGNLTFMFVGAGIIMALFNFLFFLVNRFRAFLYYAFYIVFVVMFILSLKPDFAWSVFGHMDINKPFLSSTGTASLILYLLVGRELLRTNVNFPKADKVLIAIVIAETFSLFAGILFPSLLTVCALINFASALTAYPLMLVLGGISTFIKKDEGGTYFFIASSFYMTSATIMVLQMLSILPPKILGMTAITITEVGVIFELVLFSLGLGAIFNDFKDRATKEELEREFLARQKDTEQKQFLEEQNQVLENRITERTREVFAKKEELETTLNTLRTAQNQLIESEKMASLGQFTAGVAAEIKNPINFVSNGVENLKENSRDMIEALRNFEGLSPENFSSEQLTSVIEKNKKIHLTEAIEDSDGLFKTVENGVERTLKIVNSLRNFARLDESEYKTANIHEGIDATIEILKSQFKGKAEIIRDYGKLPPVLCYPGKLNQVFLNLINNAVAAVPKDGQIKISTDYDQPKDEILISVENNGTPIPKEYHEKIFEPFYTLGKTSKKKGLGLSICKSIMDQHNGSIKVESEEGKNTVFRIRLPANPSLSKE